MVKAADAAALLALLLCVSADAADDMYSNSFISPNSANDAMAQILEKADSTTGPSRILDVASEVGFQAKNTDVSTSFSNHDRIQRSADPILSSTSGADNYYLYKNVEESFDSNDVELSGRIGHFIQPSKTDKKGALNDVQRTSTLSGEGEGAPQGRALPLPEPRISPTATTTGVSFATLSPHQGGPRQANPDIQDIITGIVKLLNGNVNVQANTAPGAGRPLRPLSTRINNRGPPRITDVPALPPDFDVPSPPLPPPPLSHIPPPMSTRPPTPYPFDVPPSNMSPKRPYGGGIPLQDQPMSGNKRPGGFYRPVTIPPWNRRRPPTRRPNPNIPPYKPMPPHVDMISFTSEKPMEDILTLDLGSHQLQGEEIPYDKVEEDREEGTHHSQEDIKHNITEVTEVTTNVILETSEVVDPEISEFERNKEKTTKAEKTTKKTLVTPTLHTESESLSSEELETTTIPTSKSSTHSASLESLETTELSSMITPSTASSDISATSIENKNDTHEVISNSTSIDILGEASPVLESSMQDIISTAKEEIISSTPILSSTPRNSLLSITESSQSFEIFNRTNTKTQSSTASNTAAGGDSSNSSSGFPYYPYRPRPGIVLDDTEYKPGGLNRQSVVTRPPGIGDIFDITVSAIQGPGGGGQSVGQGQPYVIPVDIENIHNTDVITSPVGDEGFVSIDGKRTYLNLFGESSQQSTPVASSIKPSAASSNQVIGTGYAVAETEKPSKPGYGSVKPTQRKPAYGRPRPSQPPVRIDTCIVGDDSTCDESQHEVCRTESGVSACHCRPGTARRKHRDPCRKVVSVMLSMRVDRIYERKVVWAEELADKTSDSYQQLSYEAERALESAMSMTPFSDEYLGSKVNSIYKGDRTQGHGGVFVNMTLQLDENTDTARPQVRGDIQRHLLGVIQRRSNNVGNSALWVDSPPGSISNLQDLDECSSPELHDCHLLAHCVNVFGGFRCECSEGTKDPWADVKHRAGRHCEQCSPQRCNNRGECKYQNGQEICICSGNYYGNQCELDGEVLGVAIGASVTAVVIIGLTLVCLVMWSRRWSREQKAAVGSPVFGYMATASNTVKTPVVGAPPYQLTIEDRLRWAQIADVMAQANHYAPEPGLTAPTRPSSAMFGYPNLSMSGTLQHGSMHGTLPPVPLPRLNLQAQLASRVAGNRGMRPLDNSSSSEEEDKADLLGRNFQVPRPKSRSNASIANQSGIYYDVDYDQNEIYKPGIPMSTYGRAPYFRN